MKYYALATDKDGITQVIANLPEGSQINALNVAMEHCKKTGLVFKELRKIKGTEKQNATLTKTINSKRGRKFNWYNFG